MPTLFYRGRILPSPVKVSFQDIPTVKWTLPGSGLTLDLIVRISESKVEVECTLDPYQDQYDNEIYWRALDAARACVNVAGFATGYGMTVFFDEFVRPDGTIAPLIFAAPIEILAECKAYKVNPVTLGDKKTLEQILLLVMTEPPLFTVLNDLIQAVALPHVIPANCGRVLDALRKLIAPGTEPKQGWPVFRGTIHVDEAYTTFISEHSKNPRHGELVRYGGHITTEILKRTWIIMNRFLEFRKRGNQPLPLADFPVLKG
jgi:hypothetical protein